MFSIDQDKPLLLHIIILSPHINSALCPFSVQVFAIHCVLSVEEFDKHVHMYVITNSCCLRGDLNIPEKYYTDFLQTLRREVEAQRDFW